MNIEKEQLTTKEPFLLRPEGAFLVVASIIALWAGSYYIIYKIYGHRPVGPEGVGDQFGAINALFAGLAFAGIIYTILLQRRELEMQRQVLMLQKEELRGTKEEFKLQNKTLSRQRYETTFFNLLNNFNSSLMGLDYNKKKGREAISEVINTFKVKYVEESLHYPEADFKSFIPHSFGNETLKPSYSKFTSYVKNFYQILKFVYNTDLLLETEKELYIEIVKAQLSTEELIFFYYYSISAHVFSFHTFTALAFYFRKELFSDLNESDFVNHYHYGVLSSLNPGLPTFARKYV